MEIEFLGSKILLVGGIGWIWMVHSTTMYNPIPISSINRTFEHCACVQRPHSHPACAGICATWRHWTRPPG